ncbi:MAG TPA: F0F1 ATP synthase subunit gamma [Caulobacteraceae bacterium]|nr:F0F1 ATP synthase subunit gamma [Caulobacteraceae bacterium]
MSALGEAQARIASVRKLKTVVGAMRGIAAAHTQQGRNALDGYSAYTKVISGGLACAVELLKPDGAPSAPLAKSRSAIVVFAAEHGFAGAFSERVLDTLASAENATLFVVGARGVAMAEQRGRRVDWSTPMASQASGVGATARRVADALYSGFVEERFARAEIVFAKISGAAAATVVRQPLLPIDLGAFRAPRPRPPPLTNLPPRRLIEQLVGEYVFAELALAALESFASENAARLTAMESARLNIEEKLDELSSLERFLRQEQITAEVQEVTSGALAAEGAHGL